MSELLTVVAIAREALRLAEIEGVWDLGSTSKRMAPGALALSLDDFGSEYLKPMLDRLESPEPRGLPTLPHGGYVCRVEFHERWLIAQLSGDLLTIRAGLCKQETP